MKKNYVGIREARINLSKLIKDVRSGMEIIITDRGAPVARLVPAESHNLTLEERIRNYESCGLIQPLTAVEKKHADPVELPDGFVQKCIEEERR